MSGLIINPYALAVAGGGSSSLTFDPANKDADVTLSGADLTASIAPSTTGGVQGTILRSTGKWFINFTVVATGTNRCYLGIASAGYNNTLSPAGQVQFEAGYRNNGNIFDDGSVAATIGTFVAGDNVSMAVDFDAGYVWFAVNGTWVSSGNPGGGTNPRVVFPANLGCKILFGSNSNSGTAVVTLDRDNANGALLPGGFSLW